MKFKHFSIEEREKIQELLWQKSSVRDIARVLDRSPLKWASGLAHFGGWAFRGS